MGQWRGKENRRYSPSRRGSPYHRSDHRPDYRPDSRSDYRSDFDRYSSPSSKRGGYRNQSRDRVWDREPERDRDMEPNRRDSRDSNSYTRDPRTAESPLGHRVDTGARLQLDTRVPTGPRNLASSANSPASALSTAPSIRPTPTEPATGKKSQVPNLPSKKGLPSIGDMESNNKNIFAAIYTWNENQIKHIPLRLQQGKLGQEERQRQLELSKTSGKDDFAPFTEFHRRFEEAGKAERESVNKQVDEFQRESVNDLKNVVVVMQDSVKSWVDSAVSAAATENDSVSALEAKFAEFQKQAVERDQKISEGQAQIQELLDDQKKSTGSFNNLSRDFESLKSGHNNLLRGHNKLQSDHAKLQSSHDKLQSDYDELRPTYDSIKSQHDNLLSGNSKIRSEFANIRSKQDKMQSEHDSLRSEHDSLRSEHGNLRSEHDNLRSEHDNLQVNYETLQSGHKTLQSKYSELQSKYSELEIQTTSLKSAKEANQGLNQLAEQVQSLVARIDRTESQVSAFMDKVAGLDMQTYNEMLEAWLDHDFAKKFPSMEESLASTREELQSLEKLVATGFSTFKEPVSDSKSLEPSASQPSDSTTIGEAQKAFIDEKFNESKTFMKQIVEQTQDACADMIDDLEKRVGLIEAMGNKPPAKDPEMAEKVDSLEQDLKRQATRCDAVCVRVGALEEQRLGFKLGNVDTGLVNLDKTVQHIQHAQKISGDIINELKMDVETTKRHCEAVGMSIQNLNSQWSNLSSKQMADIILTQLNPYGQRTEDRFATVEMRLKQLDDLVKDVKQSLRSKLPDGRSSDPNKKRKLNDSVQSSPTFRSSSLGQNMERPT